jgi:hypothetical protein
MTEILAVGTGAADSADITIAAGTTAIFHLKNATGPNIGSRAAPVYFAIKSGSLYFNQGVMSPERPGCRITGGLADTLWRFSRVAGGGDPVGVEEQ